MSTSMSLSSRLLDPFAAPLVSLGNEPALFDRSQSDDKGPMIGANQAISGREPPVVTGTVRLVNQSINPSIADPPADENDDAVDPVTPSANPSTNPSTDSPTNQSTNQSNVRLFEPTETRIQSERAVEQSYSDILTRLTSRELSQSLPFSKSANQSINQPPNQPIALHLPPQLRDIGDLAAWSLSSAKRGNGINALRDGSNESFWQSDGCQPHTINLSFAYKVRVQSVSVYVDFKLDESYTPSRIAIKAGNNVDELVDLGVFDLEEVTGWITFQTRQIKDKVPSPLVDDDDDQSNNQSNEKSNKQTDKPKNTLSPPEFGPHSFFSPAITDQVLPSINQTIKQSNKQSNNQSIEYTYLRCHFLQIAVLASHQSGKDTHIRQIRVFGPAQGESTNQSINQSSNQAVRVMQFQPVFQTPEMMQTMTLR